MGITAESNWNNIAKIDINPVEGQILKNDKWVDARIIDAILPDSQGKYLIEDSVRCRCPFKRLIVRRKNKS